MRIMLILYIMFSLSLATKTYPIFEFYIPKVIQNLDRATKKPDQHDMLDTPDKKINQGFALEKNIMRIMLILYIMFSLSLAPKTYPIFEFTCVYRPIARFLKTTSNGFSVSICNPFSFIAIKRAFL